MAKSRRNLGQWGEKKAVEYLRSCGFVIREQNLWTEYGELDIIASKDGFVIFFEVKTRKSLMFGPPEVSITDKKRERLIQSALAYMQEHPELGYNWQIDVISIQLDKSGTPEIFHFKNAIDS